MVVVVIVEGGAGGLGGVQPHKAGVWEGNKIV